MPEPKVILDPIPKSVKILDSYDGGANFYPDTCLHFTVSPDDLQLIFESKEWEVDSDDDFNGFTCSGSEKEWGFYSPSLENNVIIYTFVPRERDREIMITNAQMTEVYYQYYDGNLP